MNVRPVVRVASAGLRDQDLRLVRVLFSHNAHNPFDFRLLPADVDACASTPLEASDPHVLLVDPGTPEGARALADPSAAAASASTGTPIPVVHVLAAGAASQARWRVAATELAYGLLPRLNLLVREEGIDRHLDALAPPQTRVRSARFGLRFAREPAVAAADEAAGADDAIRATAIAPRANRVWALGLQPSFPSTNFDANVAVLERPAVGRDASSDVDDDIDRIAPASPIDVEAAQALIAQARSTALNARIAVARGRAATGGFDAKPEGTATSLLSARARAPGGTLPLAGRRVLVADPSVISQRQLSKSLEALGAQVQCVVGAVAAADVAARARVDLVITESTLIDTSGFAMIRRLRRVSGCRSTPVVLLAAQVSLALRLVARLLGNVTLIARPIGPDALRSLVERLLGART